LVGFFDAQPEGEKRHPVPATIKVNARKGVCTWAGPRTVVFAGARPARTQCRTALSAVWQGRDADAITHDLVDQQPIYSRDLSSPARHCPARATKLTAISWICPGA
jgi:hypothetical protein